ncbi:receptor-like protein EIX1 [Fagus crenata]
MSRCALPPMSFSTLPRFNYSKSFTSLESLVLDRNQLDGSIPKFLGDICTLRELDLRYNNFNGQLVDIINNLSGCAKDSLEDWLYVTVGVNMARLRRKFQRH